MGFGLFILNSPRKATVDSCDQCPLQNVNVKSTCSLFLKYVIHLELPSIVTDIIDFIYT